MTSPSPAPRSGAPLRRLRKIAMMLAFAIALFTVAHWSWHQPVMARARATWELSRMPPASALPVPVHDIAASRIAATFGAPRGSDRTHQGVDIFAKRGTDVLSATDGLVVSIRDAGLGGRQVWVLGPGRERYYYAHLQSWAPGLDVGDVVVAGQPLGTVGDSGNARGTPTHLHFGVYRVGGARDPLPLLHAGALHDGMAR